MSDTPFFDKMNDDRETFYTGGSAGDPNTLFQVEPSKKPQRKVVGATVGSGVGFAIAVVITWVLGMFGVETPEEVQNAFGVILVAGLTFVGGYWTRD